MVAQLVLGIRWIGRRNQRGVRVLEDGLMLKAQEECGASAYDVEMALESMASDGLVDVTWKKGHAFAVYRFGMSPAAARRRAVGVKMWLIEVEVGPEEEQVHKELRKMGFAQTQDDKVWVKGYGPEGWVESGLTAEVRLGWGEEAVVVVRGPRGRQREWAGLDVTKAMATIRAWDRMLSKEGSVEREVAV